MGSSPNRSQWHTQALREEQEFVRLIADYRMKLTQLYEAQTSDAVKREGKRALFAELRLDYQRLKESWGGSESYSVWMAEPLNNAKLNTVALYHDLVPSLERLLVEEGRELPSFYRRCRELAQLNVEQRRTALGGNEGRFEPPPNP